MTEKNEKKTKQSSISSFFPTKGKKKNDDYNGITFYNQNLEISFVYFMVPIAVKLLSNGY